MWGCPRGSRLRGAVELAASDHWCARSRPIHTPTYTHALTLFGTLTSTLPLDLSLFLPSSLSLSLSLVLPTRRLPLPRLSSAGAPVFPVRRGLLAWVCRALRAWEACCLAFLDCKYIPRRALRLGAAIITGAWPGESGFLQRSFYCRLWCVRCQGHAAHGPVAFRPTPSTSGTVGSQTAFGQLYAEAIRDGG